MNSEVLCPFVSFLCQNLCAWHLLVTSPSNLHKFSHKNFHQFVKVSSHESFLLWYIDSYSRIKALFPAALSCFRQGGGESHV